MMCLYLGVLNILLGIIMMQPVLAASNNVLIAAGPAAGGTASAVITPQGRSGYSYNYNGIPNCPGYGSVPYYGGYPYGNPYSQNYPAYGGYPYYNPYNNPYYYNPYRPTYLGRYNIGGVIQPVFGAPQVIDGNWYGVGIGGTNYPFWRAPSGFYYPWANGISYSGSPILVVPPSGGGPLQTQPPVSTVISDLNNYLDEAKDGGKISADHYQDFRQKTKYLLSKQQSMAEGNGGVLDPDQEEELRKEIERLSNEVVYRVKS